MSQEESHMIGLNLTCCRIVELFLRNTYQALFTSCFVQVQKLISLHRINSHLNFLPSDNLKSVFNTKDDRL